MLGAVAKNITLPTLVFYYTYLILFPFAFVPLLPTKSRVCMSPRTILNFILFSSSSISDSDIHHESTPVFFL